MSEIKPGHAPESNKESKETEPKITVDFFFSYHGTAEDFSRLPEALKNADVYVPEFVGWENIDEQGFNAVSQGKIEPPRIDGHPGFETPLHLIYNSKIPIIFVDLPAEHPEIKETIDAIKEITGAYDDFEIGNFDKAMENLKKGTVDFASSIRRREDFIANQLKNKLKTLTQKFPQLKNKKNIRVLISIGAVHTSLHKKLKTELQSSKMMLGRDTIVFPTSNEIQRRLIKNPQEIINDDVYARDLMEGAMGVILWGVTKDNNKMSWAIRKLVVNLSTDQIRAFSKNIGGSLGDMTEALNQKEHNDLLRKKIEEMGIKLPTTEEEIDKLLNIRKK